ncbi:MAG: acyl-CoA dehydrogenase family protein [Actinomycetota bacterium]
MDFSLTEEQLELQGLARQILADRMTLPHLKARDNSTDWYDRETWTEFARANLLGIPFAESVGGLGLGFVDLCLVLRELGEHVAPLPAIPTLVAAALPIARYGSAAQQSVLAEVVAGDALLTAALVEIGAESEQPATTATRDGDGWRLDGAKSNVAAMHVAESVLVPATADGETVLYVVPTATSGLIATRQETMNHEPHFLVQLDGVRIGDDARLGGPGQGAEILTWTLNRATIATCAIVAGVAARALRMTAQYTCDRKQFDRQIGTFQAVGQRMADCYIDSQAIELTMLAAATHLDEGRDDPLEVATAKFWASDGGNRIAHAALHVHGGISIDLDYPIHRYFLWLKQHEFALGSATPQLVRIGKVLAER